MSMTFDGLQEHKAILDSLLMKNPEMEKRVKAIIRKVLKAARSDVSKDAKSVLTNDPRHAYKAVKSVVYKRILGGNISILNRRNSTGKTTSYEPLRTLRHGQRGGNRVPRSNRTQQVMSYEGVDRAFIMRFINSGTHNRTAGSRGGKLSGNRGSIPARDWFGNASQRAMMKAIERMEFELEMLWTLRR